MGANSSKTDSDAAHAPTVMASIDTLPPVNWQMHFSTAQHELPAEKGGIPSTVDPQSLQPSVLRHAVPFFFQLARECSSAYAGRASCSVALYRAPAAEVATAASATPFAAVPWAQILPPFVTGLSGAVPTLDDLCKYLTGNVLYGEGMRDAPPAFEAPEFMQEVLGGRTCLERIVTDFVPGAPFSVAFVWTLPAQEDPANQWSVVIIGHKAASTQ